MKNIVLFHPHLPPAARDAARAVMDTRWIGQGPKVDEFEEKFQDKFSSYAPIAVGSGTDALHLSYILAGIKQGDEVIAPVFTCTATNIPLLYQRAYIKFADVDPHSLNISVESVKKLVTENTKAIVWVDYGGLPADVDKLQEIADSVGAILIEDAAHSLGASYKGVNVGALTDYTIFSFQAVKAITTGDGGMLTIRDLTKLDVARRIRWFGIDRKAKQGGIWSNDIKEVGYKYQMTDIGAAMGIAALDTFDKHMAHRTALFRAYEQGLKGISGIRMVNGELKDRTHAHWLCTVLIDKRKVLEKKLRESGIECDQVHYRNDRYSIFGGRRNDLPNMDKIEDKYEVLPLHGEMKVEDVEYICSIIKQGW